MSKDLIIHWMVVIVCGLVGGVLGSYLYFFGIDLIDAIKAFRRRRNGK